MRRRVGGNVVALSPPARRGASSLSHATHTQTDPFSPQARTKPLFPPSRTVFAVSTAPASTPPAGESSASRSFSSREPVDENWMGAMVCGCGGERDAGARGEKRER